jgi:hypothetical protein
MLGMKYFIIEAVKKTSDKILQVMNKNTFQYFGINKSHHLLGLFFH